MFQKKVSNQKRAYPWGLHHEGFPKKPFFPAGVPRRRKSKNQKIQSEATPQKKSPQRRLLF
jgi:hypothetical protein